MALERLRVRVPGADVNESVNPAPVAPAPGPEPEPEPEPGQPARGHKRTAEDSSSSPSKRQAI